MRSLSLIEKREKEYLQLWDTLIRVGEHPRLLGLFMAEQARAGPLSLRLCSE